MWLPTLPHQSTSAILWVSFEQACLSCVSSGELRWYRCLFQTLGKNWVNHNMQTVIGQELWKKAGSNLLPEKTLSPYTFAGKGELQHSSWLYTGYPKMAPVADAPPHPSSVLPLFHLILCQILVQAVSNCHYAMFCSWGQTVGCSE